MKLCSLLRNNPFKCLKLPRKFLRTFFVVWELLIGSDVRSISWSCSTVNSGGGALLNFAILCNTSIASASLPLLIRNFGDSWKWNTKYRRKNTVNVMQPSTITSYRQPILLDTVQQGSPASTAWHEGRVGSHRYLAAVPYAIAEATTTPIGCHIDSNETKNLLFWGRNSRAMVASMGMLPPKPREARK